MSSPPVNTPQDRDALIKKFEEKADSILEELESKSQGSYDRDTLRELDVFLHHVDLTEDADQTCHKLPDFKPVCADLPEHYDGFDEAFHYSPSYPLPETYLMYEKAFQIASYIGILYGYSEKNTVSMRDHSKWYEILAEDYFRDGPQGMLCGLPMMH